MFFFSAINGERVGWDVRYVKKAPDEFSTGWKLWPDTEPFNIFAFLTRNLRTSLRIFFFQLFFLLPMRRILLHLKSSMASPSRVTTHPCDHALARQKFRWLWCSHLLIFLFQMFERLGVQIFVRLACFRANETPKRTNLSFICIL